MNEAILAVQRMQDYIEAHCKEEVTLADLAKASHYSPWYARKLFLAWTGHTPADYLRRLRLSKAALLLRDGNRHILDVAMEMGFGSADGFQRAFFGEFGCNPKEYAMHPVPIGLFIPYGVKYKSQTKENVKMTEMKTVFVEVVEKPARNLILKRGVKATHYFEYCVEVGCDVWGILSSIKSLSGEPICLWLPEAMRRPGTSEYVQGVEVALDCRGEIPDGFEMISLPAATYLCFRGEPFAEEDFEDAIRQVWDAETKYSPKHQGYAWDDTNPRIQYEPIGDRGYMELKAVRKL